MSHSSQPHWLQHTRIPCPLLSPRVCSNSYPLSQWCYLTISSLLFDYFFLVKSGTVFIFYLFILTGCELLYNIVVFVFFFFFCHTLTWISRGCTCVPHAEHPSHLPPYPISQGHPSASALSTLSHSSNLDWRSVSHMIIHMFQCYSLKSSHPHLLPQSSKDCSIHLCLFCCLAFRITVTIFLNSTCSHFSNPILYKRNLRIRVPDTVAK